MTWQRELQRLIHDEVVDRVHGFRRLTDFRHLPLRQPAVARSRRDID
jgi:hypothetical protein